MKRFGLALFFIALVCIVLLSACQNPALTGAKVYIQQQDWTSAQEQLEIAIQQEPGNAEAHFLLGRAYGEKEMYEDMVREFQVSLEIPEKWRPDIERVRNEKWDMAANRGLKAYNDGDIQKAIEGYKTAIVIDAQKPEAYINLGLAYHSMDQFDEALENYNRVFELQPDYVPVIINAGSIYLNRGEFKKAEELFIRALELDPVQKNALSTITLTYERMAQDRKADLKSAASLEDSTQILEDVKSILDKAVVYYNQAIEGYPEDKEFYLNLGILYFQNLKNFQAASPNFRKVTELDPDDANAWYNLAITHVALNDIDGAKTMLERVIELEPDNADAWYQLGVIYIKKGMKAEGEEAFKRAEELQSQEE